MGLPHAIQGSSALLLQLIEPVSLTCFPLHLQTTRSGCNLMCRWRCNTARRINCAESTFTSLSNDSFAFRRRSRTCSRRRDASSISWALTWHATTPLIWLKSKFLNFGSSTIAVSGNLHQSRPAHFHPGLLSHSFLLSGRKEIGTMGTFLNTQLRSEHSRQDLEPFRAKPRRPNPT